MMFFIENMDINALSMADMNAVNQIFNDCSLMDPRAQIGGIVFIVDLSDLSRDQFFKMVDKDSSRLQTKYLQVSLRKLLFLVI